MVFLGKGQKWESFGKCTVARGGDNHTKEMAMTAAVESYANLTSVKDFGFNDASSRSRAGTRGSSAGNSFDTESSTTNAMGKVLPKWQVLVCSYKCVELSCGKCQNFAVPNSRPAGFNNRSNGMFDQRST